MATFRSDKFTFNKDTGVFSEYISSLEPARGFRHGRRTEVPVFHQVYNDAADAGLTIVSTKTGLSVTYVVDNIDFVGNGEDREIAGWWLVPTAESMRKVPTCKGTKVLVIND